MKHMWVRSWPDPVPPHRSHVYDDIIKVSVRNFDYRTLIPFNTNARLTHLDWDIAISREDMMRLDMIAEVHPGEVVVAPILYYDQHPARSVHRVCTPKSKAYPEGLRWLQPGEPTCDYVGFSCISLPSNYLLWCDEWLHTLPHTHDQRLTDTNFSFWMHSVRKERMIVDWRLQPVHLNYQVRRTI